MSAQGGKDSTDQVNQPQSGSAIQNDDQKKTTAVPVGGPAAAKEIEPQFDQEEKLMTEIRAAEAVADKEIAERLKKEFQEIVEAHPRPKLPPDVEDAGVFHPEAEAEKVVQDGTTLELPIDEPSYEKGLHMKVVGVVRSGVVVGVSSLATLAMWARRIIKLAHKHMMKIVFRKGSE